MRTLGFRTHVLFALAAAAGLVLTLGRPWYGEAPPKAPEKTTDIGDINGPLTGFFDGLKRWGTNSDGTDGWQALDHWAMAIAVMAAIAAVGVLLLMLPAVQQLARDLVRYSALAAFGIVVWKLLDTPGSGDLELRNGALAGAAFALMLLVTGSAAAAAPLRRRVPQRKFVPPPPPAYESASSSGPPS